MKSFTLLELLIVLFLISLTLGLIFPRLEGLVPFRQRVFSDEVARLLREGYVLSEARNRAMILIFDSQRRKVTLCEADDPSTCEEELSVPEEIEVRARGLIKFASGSGILFFPGGYTSGGELEMADMVKHKREVFRLPHLLRYVERRSEMFP